MGNEAVLLMILSTESGSSSMVPGRMNRRSCFSCVGDEGVDVAVVVGFGLNILNSRFNVQNMNNNNSTRVFYLATRVYNWTIFGSS